MTRVTRRMSKLVIDGVGRTFPGVRGGAPTVALQPTSLAVADNDFITILGPSGCGKSTLLRIVAGLDAPTTGRVLLDGAPVAGPGADRGMVFQSYTLFPWLTVRQNICFGLREKGMPQARQDEIAAHYVDRMGLAGFEHHYPKMLSGGMQQRTAIARALANDPEDPAARRAVRRARQPDARADAGAAARDLGSREEDRAVRHARHRGGDLHGRPRRRDERASRADQGRGRGRPAASAPLHRQDDARVLGAQGAPHRGDPRARRSRSRSPRLRRTEFPRFAPSWRVAVGSLLLVVVGACVTFPYEERVLATDRNGQITARELPCGAAVPAVAGAEALDGTALRVLAWNLHKNDDPGWHTDLARFAAESDLLLIQEAALTARAAPRRRNGRLSVAARERVALERPRDGGDDGRSRRAGRWRAPNARRSRCCRSPRPRSLRITRSAAVVTRLRSRIVHAINFTLDLGSYRRQLEAVAAELGPT